MFNVVISHYNEITAGQNKWKKKIDKNFEILVCLAAQQSMISYEQFRQPQKENGKRIARFWSPHLQ